MAQRGQPGGVSTGAGTHVQRQPAGSRRQQRGKRRAIARRVERLVFGSQCLGLRLWGAAKERFGALHEEMRDELDAFTAMALDALPDFAASAQRKSLLEELAPARRVERITAFNWRVLHVEPPLILPDCVVVGADGGAEPQAVMLVDLDALETAYMPISADRLLVGTRDGEPAKRHEFNADAAACSWDFFVAPGRTAEFASLRLRMRSKASGFVDEVVGAAVDGAVKERLPGD